MQDAEYHVLAEQEGRHWWYRSLRQRVLARLRREARDRGRPLSVFDAGCGTGGLLQALARETAVADCRGCDASPVALRYCRHRGLPVSDASVHDLVSWPERFDVVLSMDVLYHQDVDPPRAMAAMARLLHPGGLLLLNVAAMPCLTRRHDRRVLGARRFRPDELRRLAASSGLAVESLGYWNSWLMPLVWLQARLERNEPEPAAEPADSAVQPPAAMINRLLIVLLNLEGQVSRLLPLPWGSSLLLQARRPADHQDNRRFPA
ncbi:MAG: class I SAM-dependent methyltransferase [Cyanobacteria bacterium]|nr:class I SAM-dependent methyltransferase [Cyanobacteriota bacterium]